MENTKIKNNLKKVVEKYEDVIFGGKKIDIKDFYNVKRLCLKHELMDLIQIMDILESMIEKRHNDLMNRRLNLLTIWSTIFLPLSFYTGVWGMNFDDVPLISDDHGFWVFIVLTFGTIGGMWYYFKKNNWI
jgi:Mg2+ and Co2+ transporter CorA|tara:strand:+ start:2076 stop:2468 length:393 start_codon:yes stop_codon:yes gene_type:complete